MQTVSVLNFHRYGDPSDPSVVALHGLTGHGQRWENLAAHLPDFEVVAPDLRGHGRSPWTPPWHLEDVAADVAELMTEPAIVVGHSFGGAVALHLAHARPDLVKALILLDPATGLPPEPVLHSVTGLVESPDYADAAEARNEKVYGSWGEVAPELLDIEIAEHLIPYGHGRFGWRMSIPAVAAFFGELARPFVLPDENISIVLVKADKVQPAYVRPELLEALRRRPNFTELRWDCDHMVAQARPAEVAALIRETAHAIR